MNNEYPIEEELEEVMKNNKELKEVIQTYETLLKTNIEENKQLKEQLEASEKARKEAIEYTKNSSLEVNTREYGNLTVVNSDDILDILDIDKGE